jgi:membrane protease YdiL (CAAX protease family)
LWLSIGVCYYFYLTFCFVRAAMPPQEDEANNSVGRNGSGVYIPAMENTPPVIAGPKPGSRWRWAVHLILITSYLLVIAFIGVGRGETHQPALSHTTSGLLRVCGVEALSFGVVLALACWVSRASFNELLLPWRGKFLPVLLGVGYSVALRVAVGIAAALVALVLVATRITSLDSLQNFAQKNRPAVENAVDVSALRDNPAYFWLTLTLVSFVVAGLREELWRSSFLAGMKGVWPRQFGSTLGQVGAVCICAVIFGLGHMSMGILAVCMAGLLGLGLGCIMVFHRSVWPAVLAHGFFDATSMALIPWALELMRHLPKS